VHDDEPFVSLGACITPLLVIVHDQPQLLPPSSICTATAVLCSQYMLCLQVIEDYCKYADNMIGRWYVKEDGYANPSTRVLLKPLLNLFHGERKGKRWKTAVDQYLLKNPETRSVSDVMHNTLPIIDDEVLDAPPSSIQSPFAAFTASQTGTWPPDAVPSQRASVLCAPEA
jgi:hypothetical protein